MSESLEEFVGVSGFGKIKAERYGYIRIKIINENR